MYCRNCGKEVDGNREYCLECEKERLIFGTMPVPEKPVNQIVVQNNVPAKTENKSILYSPKFVFLKALLSTILGVVSFYMTMVGYVALFVPHAVDNSLRAVQYSSSGTMDLKAGTLTVVMFILALLLMAGSIYLGIRSILTFARAKKLNIKRSASTLVLGIVGLYFSVSAFFIELSGVFMISIGSLSYSFNFLN